MDSTNGTYFGHPGQRHPETRHRALASRAIRFRLHMACPFRPENRRAEQPLRNRCRFCRGRPHFGRALRPNGATTTTPTPVVHGPSPVYSGKLAELRFLACLCSNLGSAAMTISS
jgi:hypothetical protein